MTNTYRPRSNDLDHISERLRRMETRLCRLMLHMGLDPMGEEPVTQIVPPTVPMDYAPMREQNRSVLKRITEALR